MSPVTTQGRATSRWAAQAIASRMPAAHNTASSFGNSTRSGTPNQLPRSNRPSLRPMTSNASQVGLE